MSKYRSVQNKAHISTNIKLSICVKCHWLYIKKTNSKRICFNDLTVTNRKVRVFSCNFTQTGLSECKIT